MNAFPWLLFFILLAAAMLVTGAVLPYSLSINPETIQKIKAAAAPAVNTGDQPAAKAKRRLPLPVMITLSAVQTLILNGVAIFVGLLAGKQIGLGLPILQAALEGRPVMYKITAMLPAAILLGLAAGIIMLALEWMYFAPRIPRALASMDGRIALWKRALACFYGGVDEEILMRLFVMGGLAWLFGLLWKTSAGLPSVGAFWLANIVAAVLFGAGHLPATASIVKLTPMVVARALLLNGIPGLVCGYLYMRYGLEAAMLSHFSLDILLHLLAVPISRLRVRELPVSA